MVGTRRLSELVTGATARLSLPGGPCVVALSGGADSAALAFLLLEAGQAVSAIHVDHSLPGSPRMEEAATAIAGELGVRLDVVEVEVDEGPSPEEKARNARYAVFDELGEVVVTGHTRDDDAETVLLNLIRGSGAAGLAGIPHFRPPAVYRPLLEVTRSETREIAALARLPFIDDPMNFDLGLTRNQIRLRLLPQMAVINPDVVAAIARAAKAIRADHELLESMTPTPGDALAVGVVATAPEPLANRLIIRWLEGSGVDRSAATVARVREMVFGSALRQDLSGGRVAVRRGALIVIE